MTFFRDECVASIEDCGEIDLGVRREGLENAVPWGRAGVPCDTPVAGGGEEGTVKLKTATARARVGRRVENFMLEGFLLGSLGGGRDGLWFCREGRVNEERLK